MIASIQTDEGTVHLTGILKAVAMCANTWTSTEDAVIYFEAFFCFVSN